MSASPFDRLPGAYTAERRLYDIEADGELAELLVESWSLSEALHAPWLLQLHVLSPRPDHDLDAWLGRPLALRIRLADGGVARHAGIVTDAAAHDADGAWCEYTLTVQPWPALLGYTRRSQLWQDKSLVQIVESLFDAYRPRAAWRWASDVATHLACSPFSDADGRRGLTTQYRETDLAFLERLLTEEGLVYRFEPDPDAAPGQRLVILADTSDADSCPADATSAGGPGGIRFHRAASIEVQDSVQAFERHRALRSALTTVLAWDWERKRAVAGSVPTRAPIGGRDAPRLESYDPTRPQAFRDGARAERAAALGQEAHEARRQRWTGRGTVRTFTSGRTFELTQGPVEAGPAAFLLLSVRHVGINNLPTGARHRTGRDGPTLRQDERFPEWVDASLQAQAEASGYANRFEAIRSDVPWRPVGVDDTGCRLNPRPTAPGPQTATVVGPRGERTASRGDDEIHVDALGRVRVQFHFQDPAWGGAGSGPATSRTSAWVRVLQRHAGPGHGLQFVPRIGQEVLVDFIEGDIDRPVVVTALYNGRGEAGVPPTPGGRAAALDASALRQSTDARSAAQGNASGGHAPAWHGAGADDLPAGGQRNAAALSGFKTREFGGTGSNQLVFDDSDRQLRTRFATTQHATRLELGHLIHQADNHRGSFRGTGFELRTDAYGAYRAASGLLITSYRIEPGEPAGDNAAGIAAARQLAELGETLDRAARLHRALPIESMRRSAGGRDEAPLAAFRTALKGMVDEADPAAAQVDAGAGSTATAVGKVPHFARPLVAISARAGLAVVAGGDVQLVADDGITLGAGRDSHWAIGGAARLHTGQALGVLAGAIAPGPGTDGGGLTVTASHDDIDIQAQSDRLRIAARQDVRIGSLSTRIDWAAAKKIVFRNAHGSSLTLEGGNLVVACSGKIESRAAATRFVGPESYAHGMNATTDEAAFDEEMRLTWPFDDAPVVNRRFQIERGDGTLVRGRTDERGATGLQKSRFGEHVKLTLLPETDA